MFVVDNYDSFTWNLVQYLGELGARVEVARNDEVRPRDIEALAPEAILLSPGPCAPDQAGITLETIAYFAGRVPLLGVCLGHQAIGQHFGARVVRAPRIVHGKTSAILHDGRGLFTGLPSPFAATRYHSLVLDPASLPSCLEVCAWTAEGEIMAVRHRSLPIDGVQFHPESILTLEGKRLLASFLRGLPPRSRTMDGPASAER